MKLEGIPGGVRYKQTVVGAAWGLIRPLLTMLVFTFVFGKLANLSDKHSNCSLFDHRFCGAIALAILLRGLIGSQQ